MEAVIFDMDGTITRPCLDFDAIRAEMGLSQGPILEAMARMSAEEQARANAVLIRHEAEAAANSELNEGAAETLCALARYGIRSALLTRNSRVSVAEVLSTHGLTFDHVYTREDGPLKPSPVPVATLCRALAVLPAETLVVGDYLFDVQAGKAAGTRTALIIHDRPVPEYAHEADYVIHRLRDVLTLCGVPSDR